MPSQYKELILPQGLVRLFFRAPIWLYHHRLGGLMGFRFVLLTHTGRKSGLQRQTVLEIVRYDPLTGSCIVASGWGNRSDWSQNILKEPQIIFQIKNRVTPGLAIRLSDDEAGRELVDYATRHPLAMQELARFMGYHLDGTQDDLMALGKLLPLFRFSPQSINEAS